MILIDEERIYSEVLKKKPKLVAFVAPEGLRSKLREVVEKVEKIFGVSAIIIEDPCYGICDLMEDASRRLGAEIVFHVGHTAARDELGERTVIVGAYDDVSFEYVLEKAIAVLKGFERLGLCTISQHLHRLKECKEYLEEKGIKVLVGKGEGILRDGQVMGCRFETVYSIKEEVDAFAFLGQSRFHASAVAIVTDKPTYLLDPYLNVVEDVSHIAREELKKSILRIYKAREARSFGVVVGLKEGQTFLKRAERIMKGLKELRKKAELMALKEIVPERIASVRDFDAFVQTACPRISIGGYSFDRPVLSSPEADALLNLLKGEEVKDHLRRPNWL